MSDRYEREIEELLHSLEGRMRTEPFSRRLARRFRPYSQGLRSAFASFLRRPLTEQFYISALTLVILSFMLSIFGLDRWAFFTGIVSIGVFVLALALSLAGHNIQRRQKKRWRDREIEYEPYGPSIWTQLRRWWLRRR
jgi:hypothetical protein